MNGHINISEGSKSYFIYGIEAQQYKTGFKINNIKSIKPGHLDAYVDSNSIAEPNLYYLASSISEKLKILLVY